MINGKNCAQCWQERRACRRQAYSTRCRPRVAETVGYEIGLLGGSVASHTTLAAPDISVLTLTELAYQTRRIMRVSKLSLIVDADSGYGNALNAMRTVQELEHAGASALSIDDMAQRLSQLKKRHADQNTNA